MLGFLVALIILELIIRLLFIFITPNFLPSHGIYQEVDPIIGQKIIPNSNGIWTKEGFSKIEINSKGWNDYEREYFKNEKTIRVAIIGDSFIEALQVDKSNSIGAFTESWLNNNCNSIPDDKNVEVLSFGASGWGTSQMYLAIVNEVILYNPDYVILSFFPGNDLKNNMYELELNPYRPYFELKNNELILSRVPETNNSLKRKVYKIFRDNFKLVQLIREPLANIFWNISREENIKQSDNDNSSLGQYDKKLKLIDGATWGNNLNTDIVSNAWLLLESILIKTSKDLEIHNSKLITMIVSRAEVVDQEKEFVKNWATNNNISNIFYSEERLEKFGKKHNIPMVPIAKHMSNFNWEQNNDFIHFHGFESSNNLGSGHWNENGHKFSGRIVGEKICKIHN